MPKVSKLLKATQVSGLATPGLHFVGGVPGLALQVASSGARSWILRATIGTRRRDMGLGSFPEVSLGAAREGARNARARIQAGEDPIARRKDDQRASRSEQVPAVTFEACARRYIDDHRAGWKNAKHAQQWAATLEQHVFPVLGERAVRDIDLGHVLSVLEPIWHTRTETASRIRSRIELVLDWATVRKYREGHNPARWRGHLDKLLPKPTKVAPVKHHEALAIDAMPDFMRQLRQMDTLGSTALEFAILTAARSGEVRGATWAEVDFAHKVWTIPAVRMKAGREHRVPLSSDALALLMRMRQRSTGSLVFPGALRLNDIDARPLSDMTLTLTLKRMGLKATVHGMRSTFRDWAGERTAHAREVIEQALAHSLKDKAEASYARGDLFDKRRHLMQDWADYLRRSMIGRHVSPVAR